MEKCGRFPQGETAPECVLRLLIVFERSHPRNRVRSIPTSGEIKLIAKQRQCKGADCTGHVRRHPSIQQRKSLRLRLSLRNCPSLSDSTPREDLFSQESLKALKISTDKAELHPSSIQSAYLMRQAMDSVFISRKEKC